MDSLEKDIIRSKINDKNCFKLAVLAAFHHEEIKNNSKRVSKLQYFEDQYNMNEFELL